MQDGVGAGYRQPEGYKQGKKGVLFFFLKIKNKKSRKQQCRAMMVIWREMGYFWDVDGKASLLF